MSWINNSNFAPPMPGDLVALNMNSLKVRGVVVDNTCETGWLDVLLENGVVTKWPAPALEILVPCKDLRLES